MIPQYLVEDLLALESLMKIVIALEIAFNKSHVMIGKLLQRSIRPFTSDRSRLSESTFTTSQVNGMPVIASYRSKPLIILV
jgi:hypothetical protein